MSEIFYHRNRDELDCKLGCRMMLEFFRSAAVNSKAKILAAKRRKRTQREAEKRGMFCHKRHKGHKRGEE